MPCYRCHTRQTDPARGASPWRRAVLGGEQVLVCPSCQRDPSWHEPLDGCAACGSTHLAKALGLVVCRDCGARTDPSRATEPHGATEPGDAEPASTESSPASSTAPAGVLPPGVVIPLPSREPAPGGGADRAGPTPAEHTVPVPTPVGGAADTPARPSGPRPSSGPPLAVGSDLAADVEAALARMFGRGPGRTATSGSPADEADDR
ncbi:hypothetical protein I6A84_25145 [Frankia sp. CNm7]|uniref:Uncharacterized protein n=1 Tax=Frankia nepalensis TaxID=1836974 RepID=A0A937UW91_9ACTN|nr:hypothetical protein [Frankia nepalensis]MBL7502567.1 hypothetical protein [Frankia nepalensis]MBL7515142.1 hypothetical protein [Frankia nepalensis]MBL7521284.1 hypothetical protein [Frankia nepalensis]MBL7633151.1 hypothetical protein [Frankia nepalensis]